MTDQQIKRAFELLQEEEARKQQAEQESQASEEEPERRGFTAELAGAFTWVWKGFVNFLKALNESQHFDFLVGIVMSGVLGFLSYVTPKLIIKFVPNMSVTMAEAIQAIGIGSFLLFQISLVIDIYIYFRESVIWSFLKRNGDNEFDFQENIKENLSPYEQCVIAVIKTSVYLYLLVLLVTAAMGKPS